MSSLRLYTAPAGEIDYDLVRQFVIDAEAADLFTESMTFEAKEKRQGQNIAEAICAFSNTDGGLLLDGVRDSGAVGEDRIVGVPQADHDVLVNHLYGVFPDAMPEVIPVAKPGTDRMVIVLRINADIVAHPVMLAGKIFYRLPGRNVPADRRRVLGMIARDNTPRSAQSGPMQIQHLPWRPQDIPLWPERDNQATPHGDPGILPAAVTAELRVVGGLTLPRRILNRPWLDTRAKQAAVDVLNNAPLRTSPSWALQSWQLTAARSGALRYEAACTATRVVHAEARADMRLIGRDLGLLVGFRWLKVEGQPFAIALETLHNLLVACMVTAGAACAHVAECLDAAAPATPRTWEAWLTSATDNVLDAVDISKFSRDNEDRAVRAFFPPINLPGNDLSHLDQAAHDWLTYWLLDIGTRGFEQSLARAVPDWLRWPDVPQPRLG